MARKWWTLIAVSVATFMLLLDSNDSKSAPTLCRHKEMGQPPRRLVSVATSNRPRDVTCDRAPLAAPRFACLPGVVARPQLPLVRNVGPQRCGGWERRSDRQSVAAAPARSSPSARVNRAAGEDAAQRNAIVDADGGPPPRRDFLFDNATAVPSGRG